MSVDWVKEYPGAITHVSCDTSGFKFAPFILISPQYRKPQ